MVVRATCCLTADNNHSASRTTKLVPLRTGLIRIPLVFTALTRIRLRHEALLSRMEVRDRPSPRRRSGGVKLEAAWSGDRRGGWEQPRQSRAGPVLPDGPG